MGLATEEMNFMKRLLHLTALFARTCHAAETPEPIRAFCGDFNWGPGGPNGFADHHWKL